MMAEKDDEVVTLLRELVEVSKAAATNYADATKQYRRIMISSRFIAAGLLVLLLDICFRRI
jgi:hypothetical protein